MRTSTPAKYLYIHGYPATTEVVGMTEGGKRVSIYLPHEVIKQIAAQLQHTDHVGHAIWHMQNPDSQVPCEGCRVQS